MNFELSQNYFELFKLPVSFQLDLAQLSQRYQELQRTVHPDRYANASDRERRLAVQGAAHINEAFQTLKTPIRRARYMLELQGLAFDDEKETTSDPEFLMEQMEMREALAQVRDSQDPMAVLDEILAGLKQKINSNLTYLENLLQQQQNAAAKHEIYKLQFLYKLQHEAENLEEELLESI